MPRYFLELAYKGTNYSGFQVQENAISVQSVVEKAMETVFRQPVTLTGSSRTDTGVHALKNYFHFELDVDILRNHLYSLNSILPPDIAINAIFPVQKEAHCRFDAVSREYKYFIYRQKDPFLEDRAWYYPYTLDLALLQESAQILLKYEDFTTFSKRNTQVKTFICHLESSEWSEEDGCLVYEVKANRFLRGMVRGLVGTMVKVGRGLVTLQQFRDIIESGDCTRADFTTPAHGLFLVSVNYPAGIFL